MFLSRRQLCFLCFLIPLCVMFCVCVCGNIAPFGTNSLLIRDGTQQYVPFLTVLSEKIRFGESLFWTWSGGLGFNFWGLLTYYLASPLNVLIAWADASSMHMAASWLLVLKIALCGLTAGFYFSSRVKRIWIVLPLSAAYALSSYVIGYGYNIMWMDVLFILPIVALGLEKLVSAGSWKMYTLALFYALWCNYYLAYMVCIFCILWFLCQPFESFQDFMHKSFRFALCSILAACMAAVILIPGYLAVAQIVSYGSASGEGSRWTASLSEIVASLFGGTYPVTLGSAYGDINIYCGVATALAVFWYAGDKEIPLSVRIRKLLLVLLFLLSFHDGLLNLIWHAGKEPYYIPQRFSFLFLFICLSLAADSLDHLPANHPEWLMLSGWTAAVLAICSCLSGGFDDTIRLYIAVCLIVIYTFAAVVIRMFPDKQRIMKFLIAAVFLSEICASAFAGALSNGFVDTALLADYSDSIVPDDGTFYRSSILISGSKSVKNAGMVYDLNSVSLFSSLADGEVSVFLGKLGMYYSINVYQDVEPMPLTDLLFDIRYTYEAGSVLSYDYTGSIGYLMDADILTWECGGEDPFTNWNSLISSAYGLEDIFVLTDASVESACSGGTEFVYEFPDGCGDLYLYICLSGEELCYASVEVNGTVVFESWNGCILHIGSLDAGSTVTITVPDGAEVRIGAADLDTEKYRELVEIMTSQEFTVTDYTDASLSGTVTVTEEDQVLFLSVPYDDGWTVTVDGEVIEPESMENAFYLIELDPGTYEIEMHYVPPGFYAGVTLSVISIFCFAILYLKEKGRGGLTCGYSLC